VLNAVRVGEWFWLRLGDRVERCVGRCASCFSGRLGHEGPGVEWRMLDEDVHAQRCMKKTRIRWVWDGRAVLIMLP
jgi:hypothetical protein